MSKIIEIVCDEESIISKRTIYGVRGYFTHVGKMFAGTFVDEYDAGPTEDNRVNPDPLEISQMFGEQVNGLSTDPDLAKEQKKFNRYAKAVNDFVAQNDDYVVIQYSVECDVNWVAMTSKDWEKLKELCQQEVDENGDCEE